MLDQTEVSCKGGENRQPAIAAWLVVPEIGALEPVRQVGLAGRRFQHDAAVHQRIDAVGGARAPFRSAVRPAAPRCPGSRSLAMTSSTRSTSTGERPADGSSSIKRRGRRTRPCATASICCCPPLSAPPRSWRLSAISGKNDKRFLDPRRALAARQIVAGKQEIVGDGDLREHAVALDHVHEAGARRLARRGIASCRGRRSARARRSTGSSPENARSSVVLPAPLGPSSATISARRDRKSTPCSTPILP